MRGRLLGIIAIQSAIAIACRFAIANDEENLKSRSLRSGGAGTRSTIQTLIEADWVEQDKLRGGGFSFDHSREIVERGRKLLDDFRRPGVNRNHLATLEKRLAEVSKRLATAEADERVSEEARRGVYLSTRGVVRAIAIENPLLDFEKMVFVRRHPGRFPHMCDQYYGTYARPGGGLFILENAWTEPEVRNVVGAQLPEGSFLSPDLSYDGNEIVFAYTRGHPDVRRWEPVWRTDADSLRDSRWTDEVAYHLYKINVDGTGLRQLTDGPYDDFDPCWLPNGKIAFVSTRRGGYCRCGGRPVPSYTLHRMNADGTQVRRISHHETNEWHPVVAHDGRLLYTRWDYVDRHTNLAHSLWSSNADGSNPFAVFGNYNAARKPWGEWHPQPIPGSHKLLAIAGAHHGYAYGSLILIDPRRGRDGLGAISRLTPDVPFPEAEGWPTSAFTTPWALSEKYYLISYSPRWSTRDASHQISQGVYLLDSFGNRELILRDPTISSLSPIPLRPRTRPPVWPDRTVGVEVPAARSSAHVANARAEKRSGTPTAEGEFLLMSVYESSEPIPHGTIKSLRVVQILPKSTFKNDVPKVAVARQVSARCLLGTVPVEADGSAYFKAPAGVPLYFQAVDADGLAYQSMRSITYLQPGEKRTCIGCHESRHTAPRNHLPLAANRPPSTIRPGPEGTKPFSYPRLIQPILDRHCGGCHSADKAEGNTVLTGGYNTASSPHSISYQQLARRELVHWFDSVNGGEWKPRTYPGEFGARRSKLIQMLRKGHYGVELDSASFRCLAIWIDLNVPFYGVYEPAHVAAQRAGENVPFEELLR